MRIVSCMDLTRESVGGFDEMEDEEGDASMRIRGCSAVYRGIGGGRGGMILGLM